jgi:tetratricopeptide (TPR) repeat protein
VDTPRTAPRWERLASRRADGDLPAALELAAALVAEAPDDVRLAYQVAWTHDVAGLEAAAVPHYERALSAPGLNFEERQGALLGLGSTLRTLGRYADAERVLDQGVAEFPGHRPLRVFHAMARYNAGEGKAAVEDLLRLLVSSTADEEILSYRQAIELYAEDLDRTWVTGP